MLAVTLDQGVQTVDAPILATAIKAQPRLYTSCILNASIDPEPRLIQQVSQFSEVAPIDQPLRAANHDRNLAASRAAAMPQSTEAVTSVPAESQPGPFDPSSKQRQLQLLEQAPSSTQQQLAMFEPAQPRIRDAEKTAPHLDTHTAHAREDLFREILHEGGKSWCF